MISLKKFTVALFIFSLITPSISQSATREEMLLQISQLQQLILLLQKQVLLLNSAESNIVSVERDNECLDIKNILSLGSKDSDTNGEVSILQQFLTNSGYYSGEITGYYGEQTKQAVLAYQGSVYEKKTGSFDKETNRSSFEECEGDKIVDLIERAISSPGIEANRKTTYMEVADVKVFGEVGDEYIKTGLNFLESAWKSDFREIPKYYAEEVILGTASRVCKKYSSLCFLDNGEGSVVVEGEDLVSSYQKMSQNNINQKVIGKWTEDDAISIIEQTWINWAKGKSGEDGYNMKIVFIDPMAENELFKKSFAKVTPFVSDGLSENYILMIVDTTEGLHHNPQDVYFLDKTNGDIKIRAEFTERSPYF